MKLERGRAKLLLGIQGKSDYRASGEEPCSLPLCLNINFALCLAVWSSAFQCHGYFQVVRTSYMYLAGDWIAESLGPH